MGKRLILVLLLLCALPCFVSAQSPKHHFRGFSFESCLRMYSSYWRRTGSISDYSQSELACSGRDGKLCNPHGFGTGLALVASTPSVYGFGITAGYYSSNTLGVLTQDDAKYGKSGKDTFYNRRNPDGTRSNAIRSISVLAQIFLEYQNRTTDIKAGRFVLNTPLTDESDSKMAPNTFQGYYLRKAFRGNMMLAAAYLVRQKLRDRIHFHNLLRYGPSDNDNDDSGMHEGLTTDRLRAAGITSQPMAVAGMEKNVISDLEIHLWDYYVRNLFNTTLVEFVRPFLLRKFRITAGIRYINQQDNGAGKIGGAYIDGSGIPGEGVCNASLGAIKIIPEFEASRIILAYSIAGDKGDLIAPFKGYPTGMDYTRTMTEVNWEANTKAWMIAYLFDFNKAKIVQGLKAKVAFARNNRTGRLNDSQAYYGEMFYSAPVLQNLMIGLRMVKHTGKGERSYSDARIEIRQYL